MSPSVCYVVACWGGPRRRVDAPEPGFYVHRHRRVVKFFPHDLDHAVFVVSECSPGFDSSFEEGIARAGEEGIEILRRPNVGLSYGAWSDVFGLYRTAFDFYIVMEDDYVPIRVLFDRILVDLIEAAGPRCGYLGGLVLDRPGEGRHMGVSNGIMRSAAMDDVWQRFGSLPHTPDANYRQSEMKGQIGQGQAFLSCDWEIADWTHVFSTPFRRNDGTLEMFGAGPVLMEAL